jgi:thiol-disulfide isomerase/thioredoxin
MSHPKFAGTLVLLIVSIASIVMLNDCGGVQSRADQPLEKPPTALADSEPAQQALEKLKSSGAGVNTASFGIQVFLSRRPERPAWDILARVGVRRLHLNGDWVTDSDLQQVKRLGSLELLYLSAPQVDDAGIAAISQLSGLRDLTLRNVNLTDAGLAQLSHLSQLDTLQIIGSKHVHGSGLSFLHTLSLHELLLEGISLDDEPLTQLSNFRQLGRVEICDARLTDAAVPRLRSLAAGMKRLALRLRGTGISPQGLALLRRDVPGLEVVRKDVSPGLENLRAIGIALHKYHADHGCFPPAVLTGPDGRTPYSWRVALLPYLGQRTLYEQYRRNEPWDSETNRGVLHQMPDVYRAPAEMTAKDDASYLAVTGPTTMFIGKEGVSIAEVSDRAGMTLMVVETRRSIPWTKPVDILYDARGPLPKIGGFHEEGFNALVATGDALFIAPPRKEEFLRSMLSKSFYPDLKRQSVAELMGKPAPDFTLNDPAGQKTTLSTLISGKVALLSFTACRCGACRLEAPVLTQLDKKYKDRGLVVLAINAWDEPAELVRKYVESEKLTHRFLLNGHEVWRDRYHFFETPTTCWIDHTGRVINVHFGFDPGDEVALARRAEELLAARNRDAR